MEEIVILGIPLTKKRNQTKKGQENLIIDPTVSKIGGTPVSFLIFLSLFVLNKYFFRTGMIR
jgi:hypothetical protein